ncbi:MAG: lamin tail domain-containing protein, partial [Anaerolineales bacterium]
GGSWPAGDSNSRASMERRGGADRSGNWGTFTGYGGIGRDAAGNAIHGTPKSKNSVLIPTPTPTWIPGSVVINEVLIRPHYDWEGTGGVTTGDEFIELFNRGPGDVWLRGWFLDDVSGSGSRPFALPGVTISEHEYAVFFRSKTHIALNDGGDSVRLLAPNGRMIDKIHYERVRAYNLSYGRFPNGSNELVYGLWPTPGEANVLFVEPGVENQPWPARPSYACSEGGILHSLLPRLAREPWQPRWMFSLGLAYCN